MKLLILTAISLFLISCGSGPYMESDALGDVEPDDAAADLIAPLDAIPDDAPADTADVTDSMADTAGTKCTDLLRSWMCRAGECLPDENCVGYQASCDEFPCWGAYCAFMPGFCLPSVRDPVCDRNLDCDAGYTCAKGLFSSQGLCTYIGTGLCLANGDCTPSQTCAGEVISHVGSPGQGPQLPGVCLETPTVQGQCWDDGMCQDGWCDGAVLCVPGADDCVPATGFCVQGAVPACEPVEDASGGECAGSAWGNWCVGADGFNNRWCAPPPASPAADGQCWEDRECSPAAMGSLCRSALTCPPRAFCRVSGFHSGVCGKAPLAGDGLTLRFADQTDTGEVTLTVAADVVLVNRGPVAIYLLPCDTVSVHVQKDGAWDTSALDWAFSTPECAAGVSQKTILRIPPGAGMILSMPAGSPFSDLLVGRRIRLGLEYLLGCEPGGNTDSGMACLETSNNLGRRMYSPDVLWKPAK